MLNPLSDHNLRIFVQGMTSECCIRLLHYIFKDEGLKVADIGSGWVDLLQFEDHEIVYACLKKHGFNPIQNKDKILVEKIKQSIHELIHLSNNNNSIIRNSDYLVEKLGYSYTKLAKVFSEQEDRTIERYIIEQKIERTKHLIDFGQMSVSEIAFQMGYSSSQYLGTQFKQITGLSVSEYKNRTR
jgi:AraC-like DNA-binding protein